MWASSLGISYNPSGTWTRAVLSVSEVSAHVWLNGTLVMSVPRAALDKACMEEAKYCAKTCLDVSRDAGLSVINPGSLAHTKRDKYVRPDRSQSQLLTYEGARYEKLFGRAPGSVAYRERKSGRMIVEEMPVEGRSAPFAISTIAFYNKTLGLDEVATLFSCSSPSGNEWAPFELVAMPTNIENPELLTVLIISIVVLLLLTFFLAGRG